MEPPRVAHQPEARVSSHEYQTNVNIPDIRLGPRAASIERVSGVIGALGLLFCVAGFFASRVEFFQSYLFAFIYWGGFAIGGLGILVLNNTVGGRWGVTARQFFLAEMRTLPLIFLFFLVLLLGMKDLYPWMHINSVPNPVSQAILRHKQGYLNVPFFIIRTLIYFAVWLFWGMRVYRMSEKQDATG